FYGVDVFQQPPGRERALIGTYQLLGYLRAGRLVQLSPHRRLDTLRPAYSRDEAQPPLPEDPALTLQAISDYQTAAAAFAGGAVTQAARVRAAGWRCAGAPSVRFGVQDARMPLDTVEHETGPDPQWSVLWLHGLGADGNDFAPIVPELVREGWPALRFV